PRAGHARHHRLAAQFAFRTDLARDARHLRREAVQLVDHRVDGVFQLENLALDVDRDLARQIAAGYRRRDFRDVAHLRGEVRAHRVDRVGEVLPRTGDARDYRAAAQFAVGADLARHTGDFRREAAQ